MSATDRQRTFKRFNPDQRCCQCMCGDKYRTDVLDTTFSWNNPTGSTETNLDQQRWGWFGGLIEGKYSLIARREWEFNWKVTHQRMTSDDPPISIGSSTQRNVLLGVCLTPVIVLKNGDFFVPQSATNFDPDCNVIGSELGDFGANYTNYPHEPLTTEKVIGGGGFRHTQNFFSLRGGVEGAETKCEFIIPADLDNACARWDLYTASFWRITDTWTKEGVPADGVIQVTDTKIESYFSSICRLEEYLDFEPPPAPSLARQLGLYFTDRFIGTLPLSETIDYEFPGNAVPAGGYDEPGNVPTPLVTASTEYIWSQTAVAEGTLADENGFEDAGIYEVFDAC